MSRIITEILLIASNTALVVCSSLGILCICASTLSVEILAYMAQHHNWSMLIAICLSGVVLACNQKASLEGYKRKLLTGLDKIKYAHLKKKYGNCSPNLALVIDKPDQCDRI